MNVKKLLACLQVEMPVVVTPKYSIRSLAQTGLVIINPVNGFCVPNSGYLAPPVSEAKLFNDLIGRINSMARSFANKSMHILVFEDCRKYTESDLIVSPHCLVGHEARLVKKLDWLYDNGLVTHIEKDCTNGFVGAENSGGVPNKFLRWLREKNLEAIVVCGVHTDICVTDFVCAATSVKSHFGLGVDLQDVVVYVPGCETYNLPKELVAKTEWPETDAHPREIANHMGLYNMTLRGAILADQISFSFDGSGKVLEMPLNRRLLLCVNNLLDKVRPVTLGCLIFDYVI